MAEPEILPPPKKRRRLRGVVALRRSTLDLSVNDACEALLRTYGSISKAAKLLGCDTPTFYEFLHKHAACREAKRKGRLLAGEKALDAVDRMVEETSDRWALQQRLDLMRMEETREREEALAKAQAQAQAWTPPVMVIAEIRAGDFVDPKSGRIIPADEAYAAFLETFELQEKARRDARAQDEEIPEPVRQEPDERVEDVAPNVVRLRRDLPRD